MWSTCSMSTGHWWTQAPQVTHDHSTSGSMTPPPVGLPRVALGLADQRPLDLLDRRRLPAASRARPRGRRGWPALRQRVVAQLHDQHLGRERLLGVPGRALRLAAAALGAGREVEHALPAEVLDRADAELGVLVEVVDVVEGDRLAVGHQRLGRAERRGLAREQDVERRHEDVQVLGVQHVDQEDQHDADVEQQADALEGRRSPARTLPSAVGDEGAVAVAEVARRPRTRRGTGTASR